MFRNVVASMNEALDISMHLKPLASHFQVIILVLIKTITMESIMLMVW